MCVSDWRLGRLIRVKATSFVDPQAPTVIAAANKDRVGITLSTQVGTSGFIAAIRHQLATSQFIYFTPDNQFYHFTLLEHGELPTVEWRAGANPNSDTVTVLEYFLPERVLTAGIEQFKSQYKL